MRPIYLLMLAFLSGAIGLSHEVLWTRRLIDLLGATEWVTGRVLGLFFLGLSLGGWLATRWTQADGLAGKRLAIVELSIAILSVPALTLTFWSDWMLRAFALQDVGSWGFQLTKFAYSAVVVLPPAIAMGCTVPLFIRAAIDCGGSVKQSGIWIYTLNMLGGVFGLWLTSTQFLGGLGVHGTMCVVTCGNVFVGIGAFGVASSLSKVNSPVKGIITTKARDESENSVHVPQNVRVLILAFFSGVVVLALEVLLLRLLSLVAPSSTLTTSALLANVILFLALGSAAVALMNRFQVSNQLQLLIGFAGAASFCILCPVLMYYWTDELVSVRYLVALEGRTIDSIGDYWRILFCLIAVVAGGALFFSGLVFPAILSIYSTSDPQGKQVGRVLACNGVGGLVGTEIANFFLIGWAGIYGGFVLLATGIGVIALVQGLFAKSKLRVTALMGIVMAIVLIGSAQYSQLRYISPKSKTKYRIEQTYIGREGVLLVVEDSRKSRSIVMNNQYVLGSTGVAKVERRQMLLPWLLHPEAKKVCSLGLATGISVGGLELLESPPEIVAVELSSMVAMAARKHFRDENLAFFQREDNQIIEEDARSYIAVANEEFDLIVADLFRPHGEGEGRLFSIEHYQNVKRALKSGGLFCHWLPCHQLSERQFQTVATTFQSVFPQTLVVMGGVSSKTPSIALCGKKNDDQWTTQELIRKIGRARAEKGLNDELLLNAQLLIAGVLNGDAFPSTPINTLDNARLELGAGEFWILKDLRPGRSEGGVRQGFLSGGDWKGFLRMLYSKTTPVLAPEHREQYLRIVK